MATTGCFPPLSRDGPGPERSALPMKKSGILLPPTVERQARSTALYSGDNVIRAPFSTVLTLLLLSSCASLPAGGGTEPRTIVIRNRSGADIASVTLRDAGRTSRDSRFGTIAPVPQGVSQEY